MAVIRCPRGHYYDNQRFSGCPHCGISSSDTGGRQSTGNMQKQDEEKKKGLLGWLDREKTMAFGHEKQAVMEDSSTVALDNVRD